MNETGAVTPQRISEMAWGFAPPLMLDAGVKIKLFDALDGGEKSLPELTAATGVSRRGMAALVNGLVGLGILHRRDEKYLLAKDTAAFLVSGKPGFLGGVLQHLTGQLLSNWARLSEVVRTGQPVTAVNRQDGGAEFFGAFVEDLFNMNCAGAKALADELAKQFAELSTGNVKLLDIAAGSGVWGIALLQRLPKARLTAVDWPEVTPVTRRVAQRNGVSDRVSTIEGDIQEIDFGNGYQVATLGHILHSEGVEKSKYLLKKVFNALAPGGIVAIAEFVVDETRSEAVFPLIFSINMLVHTQQGDTFTFGEMTRWLEEIGFKQVKQIPVPAPSPILIAIKPS